MMKRLISLLAAMLVLLGSALAQTDIKALEEANLLLNIAETIGTYQQSVFYYDADGKEAVDGSIIRLEYDEEKGPLYIIRMDDGGVGYIGRGGEYGYDGIRKALYVCGFVGDAYEQMMLEHGAHSAGEFEKGQAIVSEQSKDGMLLITTEGVIPADSVYYSDYAGQTMVCEYTVDPKTLVIYYSRVYLRGDDGESKLYLSATITPNAPYEEDVDLSDIENPVDTRETHIITDPGTDAEFDWVLEAPINVALYIVLPDGYNLYSDKECTQSYETTPPDENGNYPKTQTYYAKPEAE